MSSGVVKWFNDEKGYGFLAGDDGRFVYFHKSSVDGPMPVPGETVSFEETEGGRGPKAVRILTESLISAQSAG